MKKILVIAAMMAMFVACQSVEDKAKSYITDIAEATADGDWEKASALSQEAAEWIEGLSPEDQAKVASLFFE